MAADTSAPMEVDRIQKGKGAGRKGQGKKGEQQKGAYNNFKDSRRAISKEKESFMTKGKERRRIQNQVMAKAMIRRVMANTGQTIPKERVMARAKAVVMAARAINNRFNVGIVVVITKLPIAGKAIMCVRFGWTRAPTAAATAVYWSFSVLLSLSKRHPQQRPPQRPPRHIV